MYNEKQYGESRLKKYFKNQKDIKKQGGNSKPWYNITCIGLNIIPYIGLKNQSKTSVSYIEVLDLTLFWNK